MFRDLNVSNGRLVNVTKPKDGTKTYNWYVSNPINNYGVNINIGDRFRKNTKVKRHFRLYVLCSQRQFGESKKHFKMYQGC
jgi:ribosomal protein L36